MNKLLVPDFASYALYSRAKKYCQKQKELFTIPLDRAKNITQDTARHEFNLIAADILGIPKEHQQELIARLQEDWAAEPSVRG